MATTTVCPILVGREPELAILKGVLTLGGVVLISGEAGIGKSRLLREFASEVESSGLAVVWGRPETVAEPGPYSLVLDLLEGISIRRGVRATEALEMIDAIAGSSKSSELPPARQIAARARGLLADLGERPVLVLEDLHLADEPSQAVVAHLARSARDDGSVIVGALRTDEGPTPGTARLLDVLLRDRLATLLELLPLAAEDVPKMLEAMWGEAASQDELASIAARGEGIPFFIEELAAARQDSEIVPSSIASVAEARLQRLSEQSRRVVAVASLSLGALDPAVLSLASGVDDSLIPKALVDGVGVGLLMDHEGRIVFRHRLLREAVASSLISVERQVLHRKLAAALMDTRKEDLERYSLTLAHHFVESGEEVEASRWLASAGNRALAAGALGDAEAAFQRSIELCGDDPLIFGGALRGLAEREIRAHRLGEAIDYLGRANREFLRANHLAEAAEAQMEEARQRSLLGDAASVELVEAAVAMVRDEPDLHARALHRKALVLSSIEPKGAIPALVEALEAADRCGDEELAVLCAMELSRHLTLEGRLAEARSLGERAMRLVRGHDLNHLIGVVSNAEASRLSYLGENETALSTLDEAASRLVDGLSSHQLPGLSLTRAMTLWRMGCPDEAHRIARRLEVGRATVGYGRVIAVWAAVEHGDEEWARSFVDSWWDSVGGEFRDLSVAELRELPESSAGGQYAQLADAVLAAYCDRASELDEDRANRYWELCQSGFREVQVQAGCLYALTLVHRAKPERAEEVIGELGVDELSPTYLGLALEVEALVQLNKGNISGARERLAKAEQAMARISNHSDRARVLIQLSETDDNGQAKQILREALGIASASGATRYANQAEAALRARGIRPRAGRPKGSARKEGLSSREEEVVTLLASGATNAEIAARLFLSERTVQDHIGRASKRLGVSGRAGLAAWAAKQGLI